MRIVIQRVKHASVSIDNNVKSAIQQGLLILLGVGENDTEDDANWLIKKIVGLRIFDDEAGVMNKSVMDINGEALVVSQFTLMASYKKAIDQAIFTLPNTKFQFRFTSISARN